jgi:hypothetical protein
LCSVFEEKSMANYANRSSKRDAKGKGKVGSLGPPPTLVPVPSPVLASFAGMVVSAAAPTEIVSLASGMPPTGKSVPFVAGTEVAPVQPKRRRLTKQAMFLIFACDL